MGKKRENFLSSSICSILDGKNKSAPPVVCGRSTAKFFYKNKRQKGEVFLGGGLEFLTFLQEDVEMTNNYTSYVTQKYTTKEKNSCKK